MGRMHKPDRRASRSGGCIVRRLLEAIFVVMVRLSPTPGASVVTHPLVPQVFTIEVPCRCGLCVRSLLRIRWVCGWKVSADNGFM
jgi:hypothetical protein